MKKQNYFITVSAKILCIVLIITSFTLLSGRFILFTEAAAIDGDHMQDGRGNNVSAANQVVRKGWGYMPGNGKFAIEDTPINYGIIFDELPFLIVKFANSRQVADGDPADLSECSITRNVIAAGVNQSTGGFKPILRTPTGLGFPSTTNYCYTWIAIGKHDLSYDGETDPVFAEWDKSTDINITESQISDLSHFTNSDEIDPLFFKSSAYNIEAADIINWNTAFGWGDHSAGGYDSTNDTWEGTGDVYTTTGNVGIGVSTPAEKLTLSSGNFLHIPGDPVHAGAIEDDDNTVLADPNGIYVSGKYAYVTSQEKDGIEILDISDPANPTHAGSITDDATTLLDGAFDVYVSGKYAYVKAQADNGVEVLDVSDPTDPVHTGAIKDDATTALAGTGHIYVSGNYAYVTSYYEDGVEILDISDPANPTHVGAITDDATTVLGGAWGIYVSGNYAYVASPEDDGVEILDVSDPTNPVHAGAITDDAVTELDNATSIYVSGKYAYVASTVDDGVEILDISDPTNPVHVGAITDNATTELNGAWGIYVSGNYAYVASIDDNGVEVLDISDPANPAHVGAITDDIVTELSGASDIFIAGKYAYVASVYDNGVEILDISGIDAPSASIGSISSGTLQVTENAQVGNNLYVNAGLNVGTRGIKSDGDLSVAGVGYFPSKIGIGTASPSEKLTIDSGNFLQVPGNPVHKGLITDNPATRLDGARAIFVSGKYAYVASTDEQGVEILDISDPSNPTHVGEINDYDNALTLLHGPTDIYVAGQYAYVTNNSETDGHGIEILDISDPSNPKHAGSIEDDDTTELNGAEGLYISGKYAYVTGFNDDGVEILDISDPSNPKHAGSINDNVVTALDSPSGIYVSGKYAYVASFSDNGVEILDISDPANPVHVGAITDDTSTALNGARDIYVSGKYAYVAARGEDGVEILDISDPANPRHVGAIFDDSITALDGAHCIFVSGKYAYVVSQYENGVEVLDISDPTNPFHAGVITDNAVTVLNNPYDIYVSGKYAYVASLNDDGVEVLDISGIDSPTASIGSISSGTIDVSENIQVGNNLNVGAALNVGIGGLKSDGPLSVSGNFFQDVSGPIHSGSIADGAPIELLGAYGIYVSGKYAYVASYSDEAIEILDVSDPTTPVHVGSISDDAIMELDGPKDIQVSGKYAYVASHDDAGVAILDISDPANPSQVGAISDDGTTALAGAESIYLSGKYAYIASQNESGVEVLDISDPAAPIHAGVIFDDATTALAGASSIYISGKYAYVTSYADNGVEILDISDPTNPAHVGAITDDATTELEGAIDIYVAGKYAYVASYLDNGVEILDISNPANPVHAGAISDNTTTELWGASSIYVSGKYAYVTSRLDNGVEVLDISDPANPKHAGSITDNASTMLDGANSIFVSGKYAYIASMNANAVEILDISGIDSPAASIGAVSAGTLEISENAQIGNNLYVKSGLNVGTAGIKSDGDLSVNGSATFIKTSGDNLLSISSPNISALGLFDSNDENDYARLQWHDPSQRLEIISTSDGALSWSDIAFNGMYGNAPQMLLQGLTGNVGIGSANPNSRLEVAGTVHSTAGGYKFPDGTEQATAADYDPPNLKNYWIENISGAGYINNNYSSHVTIGSGTGGSGSASITNNSSFSVNEGTLVFKGQIKASEDFLAMSGDYQPRGLAYGTDRNYAIEFISVIGDSSRIITRTSNGGGSETFNENPLGGLVNEFHSYMIVAMPSKVEFYIDGALVATHTENIPTVDLNIYLGTQYNLTDDVPIEIDMVSYEIVRSGVPVPVQIVYDDFE